MLLEELLEDLQQIRSKINALINDKRELMKRIQADPENKALKAKMFELNRQLAGVNAEWQKEAEMKDTTSDMMMGEIKKLFRAHVGKAMRGELTRADLHVWERMRGKLGDKAVDGILKAIHDIEKKAVASTMPVAEAMMGQPPQLLFDVNTADEWIATLKAGIKAPVVSVQKSTLGGPERVGLYIMVSVDPRETWTNNILENSRYFRMSIDRIGTLRQFTKAHTIPKKFRQTRIKNVNDALAKINRYIGEISNQGDMGQLPTKLTPPEEQVSAPTATTFTPTNEDQYKSPTRKMIRKQSMFPSSFGKSRTYSGRRGSGIRESFTQQLDSILEGIDGNPTR